MTAGSVTLNSGTGGEDVATDETGGVAYQKVKLVDGTTDGTEGISGSAANGLEVDVTQVQGTVTVDLGANNDVTCTLDAETTKVIGTVNIAAAQTIAATQSGTWTVDLGANNDVTIEGGAVLGTTGSAGPANAISVGGTESGGTFRELAVDASGNLQVDIVSGSSSGTEYTLGTATYTEATTVGTVAAAVRNDTLATLANTDNELAPLQVNASGALYVEVASYTDSQTDGAAFTIDTDSVAVVGGVYESSPTALLTGEAGAVGLTANREIKVDITSNTAGVGGGTAYTEDVATANPIVGTATMMERDDALTTVTPVEGDWIGLRGSAEGALWTQDFNSDAILSDTTAILADTANMDTNLGTVATDTTAIAASVATEGSALGSGILMQADDGTDRTNVLVDTDGHLQVDVLTGGGAGTEYVENVALGATPTGTLSMARQDAVLSATGSVDDDAQPLHVDANGALWVIPSGTVTVDGSGVTQPVSGTVTANPASGTIDTVTNLAQMGGVAITRGNGTSGTGVQRVTIASDSTGQVAVTGAALTALQLIDNPIVAHDAAASGSTGVNMAGAVATNSIEGRTQVANNDATRMVADLNGVLVTRPHTTLEESISEYETNTSGTEFAITSFGAGGAGVHNYVTDITIANTSATDVTVDLLDGSGGAILWRFPVPAGGGVTHGFSTPLKQITANTALYADGSAAATTISVSVNGFQAQG